MQQGRSTTRQQSHQVGLASITVAAIRLAAPPSCHHLASGNYSASRYECHDSISQVYQVISTDLKTTDTAKYLGITISQDMKWTKHITQTCSRANRALGFIKINVKVRSPRIKEKLYNSLVRPHVEYASAVWSPHEVKPIHQLEMVQRRAARWTLNRHHNTSFKGMLEDLQWRTLEQRRTDCRLVLLFQIIHGLVQIPTTSYLQPSLNTTSRKNHNYMYQQCSTRTNYFKYSFFPYTTVVWNNLPYQLVNSPSVISFKAQVSKLQHIRE